MRKLACLALMCLFATSAIAQTKPQAKPAAKEQRKMATTAQAPAWMAGAQATVDKELGAKLDAAQRARLQRGMKQVAQFWRAEDGDQAAFTEFVTANFAADQATLDTVFSRFQKLLEQLDGNMLRITRSFREQMDLDLGRILPLDEKFAGYDPSAHVNDDFFKNKIAFVALLNFPLTTLEERIANADKWSRREWAEVRLAQRFSKRIPSEVNLEVARISSAADAYISEYNVWMHHVLDDKGERLFPAKMRLLSHWNLRDQIKADYSENAVPRQRAIQQVMERIVTQTIPAAVIDNPQVDWNPWTNEVKPAAVKDSDFVPRSNPKVSNAPEPDTRYATLLSTFKASRLVDPYSPTAPTLIARRFEENREIPEQRVKAMLESVVSSPLVPRVAALIKTRLGRDLEPFDIWYNGFRPRGQYTETQLDEITRKKYANPDAYKADMARILQDFGWPAERAREIANNIEVDPARGSGHAMGAAMRDDKAHLRTRVAADGMDYKGYNIAVHEMGHNVEQTISLNNIDFYTLNGVPNTAFTEAIAFVFQANDMQLLGLSKPDAQSQALKTLNDFWGTYEIAGVALVDMQVWHWMYDNPNATPAQLKDATLRIAKDTWNKYYAPVFGKKDVALLAVYSHMIDGFMYLPDYPIGHLIAHQLEEEITAINQVGPGIEKAARKGAVTPDAWMMNATGKPVGSEALLEATARALEQVK